MHSEILTIIIIAVVLVLLIREVFPASIIILAGSVTLAICGIIDWSDSLSGFSSSTVLIVMGVHIVALGLKCTGVAEDFGNLAYKLSKGSQRGFNFISCTITVIMSSIMTNIMVVLIMLPMVDAACQASGGKLKRKYSYMAIGVSALMGGSLTLIGAPQNLLVNQNLLAAGEKGLGLFSYTPFGVVRSILAIVYFSTIGLYLQERFFGIEEEEILLDKAVEEKKSKKDFHYYFSILIPVLMFIGFLIKAWPTEAVAITCGLLTVIAGCTDAKTVFKEMPWNVVFMLAGSVGLSMGISKSGAGSLIATHFIALLGGSPGVYMLLIAITLAIFILCNFLSATALVSAFCPIVIAVFQELNYPPAWGALALGTALNFAIIIPYATPAIIMTLDGGYRVEDYVKVGGVFAVLGIVSQIFMYPLIFRL